jgi:hypothetical protein
VGLKGPYLSTRGSSTLFIMTQDDEMRLKKKIAILKMKWHFWNLASNLVLLKFTLKALLKI